MQNLKDFFQGASNSIASNVSAPVDGIAWLLRKAGVPMPPNPMGGSDWMTEKGLTPQPQNRTAGLLGEFAGMAGPMVAAAKAPQLAKGLLSLDDKAMDMGRTAVENHMIKNGMRPGIIEKNPAPFNVSHGSNSLFDKFEQGRGRTAQHIYTVPADIASDAAAYGGNTYTAQATPKKMIDFSDYDKLDKPTLTAMKKAAKDAGVTDKYHKFDDFLQNAMDGQMYQYYGGPQQQNAFLSELFGKFDAVKMPDAGMGGAMSKSVVFENPSLLNILERNGKGLLE